MKRFLLLSLMAANFGIQAIVINPEFTDLVKIANEYRDRYQSKATPSSCLSLILSIQAYVSNNFILFNDSQTNQITRVIGQGTIEKENLVEIEFLLKTLGYAGKGLAKESLDQKIKLLEEWIKTDIANYTDELAAVEPATPAPATQPEIAPQPADSEPTTNVTTRAEEPGQSMPTQAAPVSVATSWLPRKRTVAATATVAAIGLIALFTKHA